MPICKNCAPRFARNARQQYGRPAPLLSVPGPDRAGVLYWDSGDAARDVQSSIGSANAGAGPTMNAGWRGPTVAAPDPIAANDVTARSVQPGGSVSSGSAFPLASDAVGAIARLSPVLARFVGVVTPTGAPSNMPDKNPVATVGANRPVFSQGECVVAGAVAAPALPVVTSDMKRFAAFSVIGLIIGSVLRDANGGRRV